jgi:hypothetical protein
MMTGARDRENDTFFSEKCRPEVRGGGIRPAKARADLTLFAERCVDSLSNSAQIFA